MGTTETARDYIFGLVDGYLKDPASGTADIGSAAASLAAEVLADLNAILADNRPSYRDGVMIQLGYGLADASMDLTRRQTGGRSVAQQLGAFLAGRHIAAVKDAYQNIAKNTEVLNRGNVPAFDRILVWANGADQDQRLLALKYTCASVAATSRPVLPMPALNRSALTFARVVKLLHRLLGVSSGGAFDQFTVAALLNATIDNHGEGRARVETKNLNASDRSSFAAGDVQVVTGNRVLEAFEVTANDWRTKLAGSSKTIKDNDLSRLHIVARRPEGDRGDVDTALRAIPEDVSVLDARQVVEVIVAILTRPQRAEALQRLYEYLDRYQPDTSRTNAFVEALRDEGLVESAGD